MAGSNCYSVHDGRPEFATAIALIDRHRDLLAPLVTHHFPLDAINEAFATASDKATRSIKVQVTPVK
jgi:threonine dehydrogenase-like Zn-dependent dehydrogenase